MSHGLNPSGANILDDATFSSDLQDGISNAETVPHQLVLACAVNMAGLAGGPSAAHHIAALGVMTIVALANFLTVALRRLL